MKSGSKPPKQQDELLKAVFEENFPDFLRFMYDRADEVFDLNRPIEFMDKELLKIIPDRERKKGNRIADLLAKVFLQDGSIKWILVHTEIEAGSQKDFAFRLFQYHYRIIDRFKVPVETIVVFTGGKNQSRPSAYQHKAIDTRIHFQYRSYHIFDHSAQELLAMNNIFSLIVLACQKALLEGKVPDTELGEDRLTIAKTLLAHKYEHDRIINFMFFLKNFLYINSEEINFKFDQEILLQSENEINMGVIDVIRKYQRIQEREEGVEEGKKELISNMIEESNYSDARISRLTRVPVERIQEIRAELEKKK